VFVSLKVLEEVVRRRKAMEERMRK